MRVIRKLVLFLTSAAVVSLVLPAAPAVAVLPFGASFYYAVTPARLLDTRTGYGAAKRPVGAGQTIPVSVAGRATVPLAAPQDGPEANSVVVNVTVTNATADHGFLTLYKATRSRPGITSLSYGRGRTTTTTVTVALGRDGKIKIYNSAGSVDVVMDVIGYYGHGRNPSLLVSQQALLYLPLVPHRLIDSRRDGSGPVLSRQVVRTGLSVANRYGQPYGVRALVLNVTATGATGSGRLTAWKGSGPVPAMATVSFSRNTTTSNLTVVPVNRCGTCAAPLGTIGVVNVSSASVQVIVDVVGIYYQGGGPGFYYQPLAPTRMTDSRIGQNGATLEPKQTQLLPAPESTARRYTGGLLGSLTAVSPSATTHLAIGPGLPNTFRSFGDPSSVSALAGRTTTNAVAFGLVVVQKTKQSAFTLSNSAGRTDYVIDIVGRFDTDAPVADRPSPNGSDLKVTPMTVRRGTLDG